MKRILVAINFTDASRAASNYAASLAQLFLAKLYLVHVYMEPGPTGEDPSAWMIINDAQQQANETQLQKEIHFLKETYSIDVSGSVVMGYKGDSIMETARKMSTDLIVMGMKRDHPHRFFGSTVLSIIRKSNLPVLLVPEQSQFSPIKNIVLATDFEGVEDATCFSILLDMVEKFEASLRLLHIQKSGAVMSGMEVPGRVQLGQTFSKIHSFSHEEVEDDDVESGIQIYMDNHPINLLVMIAHRHKIIERIIGKIYTRSITYETKVPLLVLEDK
ncbi:universal stress protein [Flavisolibacter tropicus]|uniref:UspA domain-containing protein n=1 Tax=Flavisolibacter tropicus TaxID=1492898 RepID=A0A172TRC2_9BACT|nr:universal stress protein [Flavisolibacter tropicus]ANE49580.1 hypothetical protein SY85_02740 [Flavisolibacter tropicus]